MAGLRAADGGAAAPPYTRGPYTWDQHVTFSSMASPGTEGNAWFVDGTNGATTNSGKSWSEAQNTIQGAIDLAGAGDVIYITSKLITDFTGDPTSYAENITITAGLNNLSLIGVSRGRTQGGLPQLKVGTTTTKALLTVNAAGCLIANLGFNGAGATGGGILLDDDYSTKTAFGTSIINCHFKNCKGTSATNAATGGAIQWSSTGNAWQAYIGGNKFYKNVGDVVLMGTSSTVPQDVVIENNVFSGPAGSVDCHLFLKGGGSGMNGVTVRNNVFPCFPALGGTNDTPWDMTGCVGILANNFFGWPTNGAGVKTQGATGDDMNTPTTVIIAGNQGECDTELDTGIAFRTA